MEAPGHVPSVPSPKSGTAGGCTCDVVCIVRTYISEVFFFHAFFSDYDIYVLPECYSFFFYANF